MTARIRKACVTMKDVQAKGVQECPEAQSNVEAHSDVDENARLENAEVDN